MKANELYEKWIKSRTDTVLSDDFSSRVMEKIHEYEEEKYSGPWAWLLSDVDILHGRIARIAFTLGLSALGLFRFSHAFISLIP